jgi:hypothetical protein
MHPATKPGIVLLQLLFLRPPSCPGLKGALCHAAHRELIALIHVIDSDTIEIYGERTRLHSQPQHLPAVIEIGKQRLGWAFVSDLAAVEHVGAISEGQDQVEVVLDDQDRDLAAQRV